MKKGWKIFWTVIISLTGAGVVFCIIALCLGVTFSQFENCLLYTSDAADD